MNGCKNVMKPTRIHTGFALSFKRMGQRNLFSIEIFRGMVAQRLSLLILKNNTSLLSLRNFASFTILFLYLIGDERFVAFVTPLVLRVPKNVANCLPLSL